MQSTGPENILTRQPLIEEFVNLGWDREQIMYSPEWKVPKTPSEASKREKGVSFAGYPVDLAIFDSPQNVGDYRHIDIIVETKKPNSKEGINQLIIYLGLEPLAKLGIWTNGSSIATVHRTINGSFKIDEYGHIPYFGESLIENVDKPLTWENLKPNITTEKLRTIFDNLLCAIVSQDTQSTRPEERLNSLCNVLLAKIESDKIAKISPNAPVSFQLGMSTHHTAEKIRTLFRDMLLSNGDLFADSNESINFNDSTIEKCVFELAQYRIFGLPSETVSMAFQVFRQDTLKAGDGQYFTPPPVIKNAAKFLEISPRDKVLDPACGTGGFLVQSYLSLRERFPSMDDGDAKGWAQRHLYGVDKDKISVKLTKAVMLAMGDGSTNTYHGDSIRSFLWAQEYPLLNLNLKNGQFNCILTNPPFGKNLKISARDGQLLKLDVSHSDSKGELALNKEVYTSREIGIAFIEKCYHLLDANGKLGILLPETYFFSTSYLWLQSWIYEHFTLRGIVNIPMEAFQGFCRAKTNLYIFEKGKQKKSSKLSWVRNGKVLIVNSQTCGINKDGDELYVVDKKTGQRDYSRLDDQLSFDCNSLFSGAPSERCFYIDYERIVNSMIGVPNYYDAKYDNEIDLFCAKHGFSKKSLGELVKDGMISIMHGHGSPSPDQRVGNVPYIKVSDLRASQVNINPTNMIPLELAKKYWKGDTSKLQEYDLLSPERASKNIGEFCVLQHGQENIVLTKEILVVRGKTKLFDQFYLMWALSLPVVRRQWDRIVFMQTNREDVGDRYYEIEIPIPLNVEQALAVSKPYRDYYTKLKTLRIEFEEATKRIASES